MTDGMLHVYLWFPGRLLALLTVSAVSFLIGFAVASFLWLMPGK